MLSKLQTYLIECDNCGMDQEVIAWENPKRRTKIFPDDWGRAELKLHSDSRLPTTTHDLCPHCIAHIQKGSPNFCDKYSQSTLKLFGS